jgi:vacuolar-type H+-ATPase subunit H
MGSKRDRNVQANLRRGREELVIARQKVAAVESRISEAREEARRITERAHRDISLAHIRMKDHQGRLMDVLNRLYLMQLLSEEQLREAKSWVAYNHVAGPPRSDEESLYTMFTQQHYTAIAKVIRETRQQLTEEHAPEVAKNAVSELQANLMKMLSKDNPKFKDLLFIAAASEHGPEK